MLCLQANPNGCHYPSFILNFLPATGGSQRPKIVFQWWWWVCLLPPVWVSTLRSLSLGWLSPGESLDLISDWGCRRPGSRSCVESIICGEPAWRFCCISLVLAAILNCSSGCYSPIQLSQELSEFRNLPATLFRHSMVLVRR